MITRFPSFSDAGGYESFCVRGVDPDGGRAAWLRQSVHQAPGGPPLGSIWVTLFDAGAAPVTYQTTVPSPAASPWLTVGASRLGPSGVRGDFGRAAWDLSWTSAERPFRHLPSPWMYERAVPSTKPETLVPDARVHGQITIGGTRLTLDGWPGMVGHSWGPARADRWIWLHGTGFEDDRHGWLDLTLSQVRVGPRWTSWVAAGAASVGGRRVPIGGPLRMGGGTRVRERANEISVRTHAGLGVRVSVVARSLSAQTVVWRYEDPFGAADRVADCSISELELEMGRGVGEPVFLATYYGGALELGARASSRDLQPRSETLPAPPQIGRAVRRA